MRRLPRLHFHEATQDRNLLFRVVRHRFRNRSSFSLHTHADFAEVFWVENGTGTHLINGEQVSLQKGSLVMVRPRDVHGFRTNQHEDFTIVNVSFFSVILKDWKQRYFAKKALFFWDTSRLPYAREIAPPQILLLQRWTDYLSTCPNLRFHFDWFLMELLHSLLPDGRFKESPQLLPNRLSQALARIEDPLHFPKGPRHLAKLAGCSLQHLNRLLKKQTSQTAGEIVNRARLNYAARQLRLSDQQIVDIGLNCGFDSLGHFYHMFKKKFGETPRKFRLSQQRVLGQSGAPPAPLGKALLKAQE